MVAFRQPQIHTHSRQIIDRQLRKTREKKSREFKSRLTPKASAFNFLFLMWQYSEVLTNAFNTGKGRMSWGLQKPSLSKYCKEGAYAHTCAVHNGVDTKKITLKFHLSLYCQNMNIWGSESRLHFKVLRFFFSLNLLSSNLIRCISHVAGIVYQTLGVKPIYTKGQPFLPISSTGYTLGMNFRIALSEGTVMMCFDEKMRT